jgi:hypothetical protein
MKDKISLYTVLTMIALLGCLGMAAAQDTQSKQPTPPVLMSPELHNELTQDGTLSEGAGFSSTEARTSETGAPRLVSGWNFVHATTCLSYWDGVSYWLYVYPPEGGYWFTGNPTHQYTIAPACQTGYWLAFYVYNVTIGAWDRVQTYTYR